MKSRFLDITRRAFIGSSGAVIASSAADARRLFPGGGGQIVSVGPGGMTAFITTVPSLAGTQSDTLYIGYQFTVGSQNLKIWSLGRWKLSGNSGTHLIKMVRPYPDQTNVPNAFTTVNLASGVVGTFVYGDLLTPIILPAGSSFYIVSDEVAGGDTWHQLSGPFGHTAAATIDNALYGIKPNSFFVTGTANQMFGPLDFKYETTAEPATTLLVGSLYSAQPVQAGFSIWARVFSNSSTAGTSNGSITGVADLRLGWNGGIPTTPWTGVIQYYYDNEIPIGSPVVDSGFPGRAAFFMTTWDTTLVANGTHVVYARCIDAIGWSAYNVQIIGNVMVVHNGGFVNGPQDVWVVPGQQITHRFGGVPDKVHFDGNVCPVNASHLPYNGPTFIPPATADARYTGANAALLRDSQKFLCETSRANDAEWEGFFRWAAQSTNAGGGLVGPGGGVFAWSEDPHRNGVAFSEAVSKWTMKSLGNDGGRFDNYVNAGFATYCEAPAALNGWLVVDLGGRLLLETHEGTVTTIAGPRMNRSSPTPHWVPIDDHLTDGVDENLELMIAQGGEIVGTFDSGIGAPEYMLGAVDLCVDPRNSNIVYVASEYLFCIFKVNMTGWPGTPAHVSLYAGHYDEEGFVNVAGTGAVNAKFNAPLSIQMAADGTMYVADCRVEGVLGGPATEGNQCIRKISPDGLTVTTLVGQVGVPNQAQAMTPANIPTYSPTTSTPIPFASAYIVNSRCIRFNSTGTQLISLENNTAHVRKIDLVAQTVTFIGRGWNATAPVNMADFNAWVWLDCDRKGSVGPVDDMILNNPTIGPAAYRMSKNGPSDYGQEWSFDAGVTQGVLIGTGAAIGSGHYGWTIAIADLQGRIATAGTLSPAGHRFRIAQATGNDALFMANPSVDQGVTPKAQYLMTYGSSTEWPANCRPSFYSLFTKTGQSQTGTPTFDDLNINYPTDAGLGAFLQAGAGGIAARPELTGKDLRALIYYIRRFSYTGSYPNPTMPVPDGELVGLWYPIVTSINATALTATSLQVTWTTDKPTIGMAVACTDNQFSYAGPTDYGRYNRFSPIEPLSPTTYATSHTATITNLQPNHTIHYSVLVKDDLGNFSHAPIQTIALPMSPDGTEITTLDLTGRLVTVHGIWTWGANAGPTPGWGGGPFHRVLLNGQPATPGFIFGQIQKLGVYHGGNVYGVSYDQIWAQWVGGNWQPNDTSGHTSPPLNSPAAPTLPGKFIGPYLPSPDGTVISGGTGTVTTREGDWTFGLPNGAGWDLMRNGQPHYFNDSHNVRVAVNEMRVHSGGRLWFFRLIDNTWQMWASQQQNASSVSSIGMAVPFEIVFDPPRATVSASAAAGTFIARVWVKIAEVDGHDFTGTLSVSTDSFGIQMANVSGMNLVKGTADISGEVGSGSFFYVTATQNSTSLIVAYNVQVGV